MNKKNQCKCPGYRRLFCRHHWRSAAARAHHLFEFSRNAATLLVAFATTLFATAAIADDWADCRAEQELALTACTAIIERGGTSKELMEAHTRRGNVRNRRGDLDGAFSDANRAVELDPHVNALF